MKIRFIFIFWLLGASAIASVPTPQHLLSMVNHYRIGQGLRPLTMDAHIAREAKQHSQAMANHSLAFGHQRFAQRVYHVCAKPRKCKSVSENVAFNHTGAQGVLQQWIHSPIHRHNLLAPHTLTGIGIATDKAGRIYYTQIFVTPDKTAA